MTSLSGFKANEQRREQTVVHGVRKNCESLRTYCRVIKSNKTEVFSAERSMHHFGLSIVN